MESTPFTGGFQPAPRPEELQPDEFQPEPPAPESSGPPVFDFFASSPSAVPVAAPLPGSEPQQDELRQAEQQTAAFTAQTPLRRDVAAGRDNVRLPPYHWLRRRPRMPMKTS